MFSSPIRLAAALLALTSPVAAAPQYATIYAFTGGSSGAYPESLVADPTYLYVATAGTAPSNGTVNRFDPASGQMVLLHALAPSQGSNAAPEGQLPGSLILVGGKLYGLTASGGPKSGGTVFSIDPATGALQTVYAFDGTTNGAYPGSIVNLGNLLYVATGAGGPANAGTLVKIDLTTGTGSVAYSFQNGADGAGPGGLVVVGSQIFGTALTGGTSFANGKLFSYDPASGMVTTRYTFTDGADGGYPSNLSLENGKIYGFASGGTRSTISVGFVLDPSTNAESTWLTFKPGKNHCEGFTAPVAFKQRLLATGNECGPPGQSPQFGPGIVFAAGPATGKMRVLSRSTASGEIANGLIGSGSVFYGITTSSTTMGTIFKLRP